MSYVTGREIALVIRRKYVQQQDARQAQLGLSYTTAETDDLGKFIAALCNNAYNAGKRVSISEEDIVEIGNEVHRAMPDGTEDQTELIAIVREIEKRRCLK